MKATLTLASILVLAASYSSSLKAQSISYDNVSVSYVSLDSDGFEPSGFGLSGMRSITDNVFVGASYTSLNEEIEFCFFECTSLDLTMNELHLGLGYRVAFNNTTDGYATVSYVNMGVELSVENESESNDESGYSFAMGLRSMLTENLEVRGGLTFVSVNDNTETGIGAGLSYYITPDIALGVNYSSAEDVNGYGVNAQYNF